jgi:polyisoprenoid-binding protein YceI
MKVEHIMLKPLALFTGLMTLLLTPLLGKTFKIDASHSSLIFAAQHMGLGNTYGRINDISGTITFDENDLSASAVAVVAKVASVDTHNKKRDAHLRNADFFDAARHPTITFSAKGFKKIPGREGVFQLKGDLTLLGTTKTVEVELSKIGEGLHFFAKKPAIGFETEFFISRKDYKFGKGKASGAVGDRVRLIIALEAIAE